MILDILGSAGLGTIVGGVFGWLGKREERKSMDMQNKHQLNMLKAKTDATIAAAKMSIEEAKVAGALLVEKLEAKAFEVSQTSTSKWADLIKSVIRPIVLFLLMWQTYKITVTLEALTGGLTILPQVEIIALFKIVILSTTGLTATAVGWYFAARTSKQFDRLLDIHHPKAPKL